MIHGSDIHCRLTLVEVIHRKKVSENVVSDGRMKLSPNLLSPQIGDTSQACLQQSLYGGKTLGYGDVLMMRSSVGGAMHPNTQLGYLDISIHALHLHSGCGRDAIQSRDARLSLAYISLDIQDRV